MKKLALASLLLLCACGARRAQSGPVVVSPTELMTDRLVPVLCSEVVEVVDPDSDGLATDQSIEEKAFRLTRSDAQHRRNIAKLEAAAIRCGVKVTHKAQ